MVFQKLLLLLVLFVYQSLSIDSETIEIHETRNNSVPSINYIVDAVYMLKTAYEIYSADQNRTDAYVKLYGAKYTDYDWNVVMCYKSIKIWAPIYVELLATTEVTTISYRKRRKNTKKVKNECLVMLFSSNKTDESERKSNKNCSTVLNENSVTKPI